jgi:hypothetical protein
VVQFLAANQLITKRGKKNGGISISKSETNSFGRFNPFIRTGRFPIVNVMLNLVSNP